MKKVPPRTPLKTFIIMRMCDGTLEIQELGDGIRIVVSKEHRFGVDAFLLSYFCEARRRDRVCDLGTGCGILPLIMWRDFRPREILGVDIQEAAVEQFRASIDMLDCNGQISGVCADLRVDWDGGQGRDFDLVTCNPPYWRAGSGFISTVKAHEIARHEIMCTPEDLCLRVDKLLKFGGRFCFCQKPERLGEMVVAMNRHGLEAKRLRFVVQREGGKPWLMLMEARKGGRPGLDVLKQLVVEGRSGEFSDEMRKVYRMEEML